MGLKRLCVSETGEGSTQVSWETDHLLLDRAPQVVGDVLTRWSFNGFITQHNIITLV